MTTFVRNVVGLLAIVLLAVGARAEGAASVTLHDAPLPVPTITFEDGEGRERTLEDFRGRTILLNLWATWCVPCVEEMPTLEELQRTLGGEGFEVVALSIDQAGAHAVAGFYERLGIGFLASYNDASGDAWTKLGAAALPTTLLIDGEGREVGRRVGPAEWDAPDMVALLRRFVTKPAAGAAPRRSVWRSREP